jgi:hypothetical protein
MVYCGQYNKIRGSRKFYLQSGYVTPK